MLHVSCMVWGIRRAAFPVACREDVCLFLVLPSHGCSGLGRAELGDSHDIAGTLTTLWFVHHTGSCCAQEIPSPLPSCPSAASPWHLPALGVGTASPWGCSWEQEGQGQLEVWPIPCQGNTHVQSGAEPEHLSGTCFPSSPKAAFLEHLCVSVCPDPPTPAPSFPCACMSCFFTDVSKML